SAPQKDKRVEDKIRSSLDYNTNIFVCNGDILALLSHEKSNLFKKKYNIHYGAWELRKYPEEWMYSINLVDEYWAMSSFLQKSVSDVANIPVIHMPYPVDFEIPTYISRKDFGLPEEKFLFIFTFDLSSLASRKNPYAVIKAFLSAFPSNNDVGLVIKASSNKKNPDHKKQINDIMDLTKNDSRVHLINEILPRDKILGLINSCDVYVSLHRAEGFGIGMAEAMKMGKVVIATDYSGNTDFTLSDNSCPVDYKLIDLKPLEYIYEQGKQWADPDIEHASFYMKKLYEDRWYYNKLAKNGKNFIDTHYNAQEIMKAYDARLKILGLI
ncbi:MAG: glycosyltransferase family 4 protein, partial [Rickettsiaceae bacterium]|nr:glycosyltransferase family 4 protein [Rickettsiaceae bacterium]